jgi:hypothetical protein
MIVAVETAEGVYTIDSDSEQLVDFVPGAELPEQPAPHVELPLLVAAAAEGSTVVALVKRRPPLVVSHDTGRTWREAGAGLPPGTAVAVAENDPDRIVFATESRLYISTDGARFWRSLAPEVEGILRIAWFD